MTSRSSVRSEQHRQHALLSRVESLSVRLEAAETRQRLLEHTVRGLARESGISVGSPCTSCEQCHVLVKDGIMYCPRCGDRRTV